MSTSACSNTAVERWPELRYDEWKDTLATLHLWSQIAGKIRLRQESFINHWWHVTFYVTQHGLTTSMMPYSGGRTFGIDFDFIEHRLRIVDCDGRRAEFALEPMSVAAFYDRTMRALNELDIHVKINTIPNEIAEAIPFERDTVHASYDKRYVERFWRALLQADRLCKKFRAGFIGKSSPVHFFWGAFDLAVTRFSGRVAPPHPGGFPNIPDWAMREAYSHEVQSVGFWPGGNGAEAMFYSYAYPAPPAFSQAAVRPDAAAWYAPLGEFILPYEAVRTAADPDAAVLDFFNSTYEAAAETGHWDRAALERASMPRDRR
jgi:hypothetical protein